MERKGCRMVALFLIAAVVFSIAPAASGQEKPKAEGAKKETGAFAVVRIVVGTGVENREPVGEADKFPAATEKVYCLLEATNIPKDMEITLLWFAGDKQVGEINIPLKQGPKWRTWAFKNLRGLKGDWKVEAKTPDGKILKEITFKVE
ncbi:MAG: DUF2914 domain-containing protein [Deltaproteobacteria bacterium]|nr:DUF2914 domain-containing protein [Deltaproteobacteria bacterium]